MLSVHSDDPLSPVAHAEQRGGVVPLPACVVAAWELSGDADDATSNGNDGVVHGAVPVEDREGEDDGAYYFDGSSYIEVPGSPWLDEIEVGGAVTMAAWVWVEEWHVRNGLSVFPILERYDARADNGWTMILLGPSSTSSWSDQLDFATSDALDVLAPFPFAAHEWYFVATTFDTDTDEVGFFVDGERIATGTSPHELGSTGGGDIHIGLSKFGLDEWSTGVIDDVYVFGCALSDDEVYDLSLRY